VLFWVAVAFFVIVVLGTVMRVAAGLNTPRFLAYFREELTIVLATASSDTVLPPIMRELERMGVKPSVVGLLVPTRYSFDLDAFSICLTHPTVFIAQATHTPLSFGDRLLLRGISLVTSKGEHGMPASVIVILAATLNTVPAIPAIGLVLVLSIDRFIGTARGLGNLIGNCVATVVIGAWEKDLDVAMARQVVAGDVVVDIIEGAKPADPAPANPAPANLAAE
jgi:aerobic C4-dicarboxylate transport protein